MKGSTTLEGGQWSLVHLPPPPGARTHVSHAMVKLGARDRAQLMVVAYQTGLVSPGPAPPPG
jgi:hypothetical protein